MLVLTRKPGQTITIGDDVKVTIMEVKGGQVKLGIEAPKDVAVFREEIYLKVQQENIAAAQAGIVDLRRARDAWLHRTGKLEIDEG